MFGRQTDTNQTTKSASSTAFWISEPLSAALDSKNRKIIRQMEIQKKKIEDDIRNEMLTAGSKQQETQFSNSKQHENSLSHRSQT